MKCPACQAEDATVFESAPRDREYYVTRSVRAQVMSCSGCGSLFQTPWPTQAEALAFYAPDYQNYRSSSRPLLARITEAMADRAARGFVEQFGADARTLDFGCGDGGVLKRARRFGLKHAVGYEPAAREFVESEGVSIYGSFTDLGASGERFDVIRMNHVIEHLADLDSTMSTLATMLSAGGRIAGQTPNGAHPSKWWGGTYWGPLHYPYHTVLFSPDGLAKAAPRWGLKLDRIGATTMPTAWSMTAENMMKGWTNSKTRGRTPYYPLLLAASIPFIVADRLAGQRTAIFDFELVKQ